MTLAIFVAAVVMAFVGSHGVASASIAVAIVIAFFAIGGAALRSGGVVRAQMGNMSLGRVTGTPDEPGEEPEPEYIPEAGRPSEAAWAHEQELYRRKESGGDE